MPKAKMKLKDSQRVQTGRKGRRAVSKNGNVFLQRDRVYAPVKEIAKWLDQHAPGWSYGQPNKVVFANPNDAFHFKMRWG